MDFYFLFSNIKNAYSIGNVRFEQDEFLNDNLSPKTVRRHYTTTNHSMNGFFFSKNTDLMHRDRGKKKTNIGFLPPAGCLRIDIVTILHVQCGN